jgi:hypothetical protein
MRACASNLPLGILVHPNTNSRDVMLSQELKRLSGSRDYIIPASLRQSGNSFAACEINSSLRVRNSFRIRDVLEFL